MTFRLPPLPHQRLSTAFTHARYGFSRRFRTVAGYGLPECTRNLFGESLTRADTGHGISSANMFDDRRGPRVPPAAGSPVSLQQRFRGTVTSNGCPAVGRRGKRGGWGGRPTPAQYGRPRVAGWDREPLIR